MRKASTKNSAMGQVGVGVAEKDITPPLNVGLLMSSVKKRWAPFQSVRTPLKARVLVLELDRKKVALVSLDLLALNSAAVGGWTLFKRALARAIPFGFQADHIVIACTHTHSAPDSSGITDLYRTQPCRRWIGHLRGQIVQAISEASARIQPCRLAVASTDLQGFSLQRRIPTESGIRMSDSMQPIAQELFRRGPVDRRVHSLSFRSLNGATIATLVHAACHAVHEMCIPRVSADFPGELCAALAACPEHGFPLFFNGAAGDTNPPTVSEGAEAARRHGQAMAEAVQRAQAKARTIELTRVGFCARTVLLPSRSSSGAAKGRGCRARLSALRLGPLAVLFLPGEPFTQIACDIEQSSPFDKTLVAGYCENSIGYVPTRQAFEEGGYEIGPGRWSFLQKEAESIIRKEATLLLKELWEM